jgi:CRP/FNR family cyclic AMP-dependent transcriptional regulator
LIKEPYPASAVASDDTSVIKLNKEIFLTLLKKIPEIHYSFTELFAKRDHEKSIITKEIAIHNPEHRILKILNLFRKNIAGYSRKKIRMEISRQHIADMTGLRVETVIRTIKNLEKREMIKIIKGKIYL